MKLVTTNTGSYPRVGETDEEQILRRTIALWEQKKKSVDDLKNSQETMTLKALSEQEEAGLDLVTDGQICWYDPISHLFTKMEGVRINGLLRFFDTNFYFRQPVIEGELKRVKGMLTEEYQFARNHSRTPVKVVLTGPYTLAKLSIVKSSVYPNLKTLAVRLAELLNEELKALVAKGARVIQIDEPAILFHSNEFDVLEEASQILVEGLKEAEVGLQTYFGNCLSLYDRLQKLPFSFLGLDFTYSPHLADHIAKHGSEKKLGLGVLDGRNTKLEDVDETIKLIQKVTARLTHSEVYVQPSCGLEYLPRYRAFDKLKRLAEIKKRWMESKP